MTPGEQIPTEHELAERYAASRTTIREALKLLEREGLVDVHRGRGRFVSRGPQTLVRRPITTFESLTEMLVGLGFNPTKRVISAAIDRPTEEESAALRISSETKVVRMVRLYESDGQPLIVSITCFDAALLAGEPLTEGMFEESLDRWLASRSRRPESAISQIRAEHLPASLSAVAAQHAGEPWISITECCADSSGEFVLYARDYHRGDLFTFTVLRRREH